jgi:dihydroxyacetone kinase-like predicted kinase
MPPDEGLEVMCTIALSPLDAAMLRQRLDEMGDSVIMSQVDGAADASGHYRWRVHVHVHVPDPGPAVALIRSLGEPTDLSVSELSVPRDSDALGPAGHER